MESNIFISFFYDQTYLHLIYHEGKYQFWIENKSFSSQMIHLYNMQMFRFATKDK